MTAEKKAIIIFTRIPVPGHTKTRMMPYCTAEECAELHRCFLRDIAPLGSALDADVYVYYTGGEPDCLAEFFGAPGSVTSGGGVVRYREQSGTDIGERMARAFGEVLPRCKRCVLIGSDIPELSAETICKAFDLLESADVVLTPTAEGGYCLVGMKEPHCEIFDIEGYGGESVLADTASRCSSLRLHLALTGEVGAYHDLDDRSDLADYRERMRRDAALALTHTGRFLTEKMTISVIVPMYNEEKTIAHFLEELAPYAAEAEILLADGGSSDDTLKIAGERFVVVHSPKGRAVQMNRAAEKACGDVLFFLHADSLRLPEDMLDAVRAAMTKSRCGCFHIDFPSDKLLMRTNTFMSNLRVRRSGIMFGDQGIFIDRRLFEELGGFTEIPIMEDLELSLRLRGIGIVPRVAGGTIVTSARRYGESTLKILRTEYRMWRLRRRYIAGEDPAVLAAEYGDKR